MCGIAGFYDTSRQRPASAPVLEAMCATVRHRGPDDCGRYLQGPLAFGFRRLSILDLDHGRQPMFSEDGRIVSICNGELYNYADLRRRLLASGHCLKTRCDAEVLPHLYEEYGIGLLDHLDGQFAFALFDTARQCLYLARDHFGVNPVFYATVGGTVIFGSEIKALLEHPLVPREVDLGGLDQVITLPGLASPQTMVRGVRSLCHGHYLRASADGVDAIEYWDLDYPEADGAGRTDAGPGDAGAQKAEELTTLLARSVGSRLQSDVPVGIYLSGGLDSSLIAALMRRQLDAPLHSFSIVVGDGAASEAAYQQRVADALGCRHRAIRVDPHDVVRRLPAAVYHAECALRESYNTASLALSEQARASGVPVVLTGQGADELFAGYIGYRFDQFSAARPVAHEDERRLRARLWGDEHLAYDGSLRLTENIKRDLYAADVYADYEHFSCLRAPLVPLSRLHGRHVLHKRAYLDFRLRLVDHLLGDHGDRMAMAHGVEARHPFLDRAVVDFVRDLPVDLKLRDLEEKYLVRRVAQPLVPAEVVNREKFGWYAPGSHELLRSGADWFLDCLADERVRRDGVFNPATVRRLKAEYAADDFVLSQPFEIDVLMVVATFNLLLDTLRLSPPC